MTTQAPTLNRRGRKMVDFRKGPVRLEQLAVKTVISGRNPWDKTCPGELVTERYEFRKKQHVKTLRRDGSTTITDTDYVLVLRDGKVTDLDVVSESFGYKGVASDYDQEDKQLTKAGL